MSTHCYAKIHGSFFDTFITQDKPRKKENE